MFLKFDYTKDLISHFLEILLFIYGQQGSVLKDILIFFSWIKKNLYIIVYRAKHF